jgi:hypothetical protein
MRLHQRLAGAPITTKFAELFRFTFLYSANTSRFLLLILTGSSTERFLRPLLRSTFVFAALLCIVAGLATLDEARWQRFISSFNPADLQLEPLELCAFVTTSSGLGSVKSNDLARGSLKLIALAKSFARLGLISTAIRSRAMMVAANGDGFARMAVEGSRLAGGLLKSALDSRDSG